MISLLVESLAERSKKSSSWHNMQSGVGQVNSLLTSSVLTWLATERRAKLAQKTHSSGLFVRVSHETNALRSPPAALPTQTHTHNASVNRSWFSVESLVIHRNLMMIVNTSYHLNYTYKSRLIFSARKQLFAHTTDILSFILSAPISDDAKKHQMQTICSRTIWSLTRL